MRTHKATKAVAIATLILAATTACNGTTAAPTQPDAASTHVTAKPATPAKATSKSHAAAPSDGITGFGALDTVWNHEHTPTPGMDPGTAYDSADGLGLTGADKPGGLYATVEHDGGRVDGLMRYLHKGTPLSEAKATARSLLPADTQIVWQKQLDTCYVIQYRSKTLGRAFGTKKIGDPDGAVFANFDGPIVNGDYVWKKNDVRDFSFMVMENTASDTTSC